MESRLPVWTMQAPLAPQASRVVKLGGLPLGWQRPWPVCAECGRHMSLLAQVGADAALPHVPADHVLFLFTCERETICSFWDPDGGANAAVLVPAAELGTVPVPLPDDAPPLLLELWVARWRVQDDGVPAELAHTWFDDTRFFELPDQVAWPHDLDPRRMTKVGGMPLWTANGPVGLPDGEPWHLVLQLDVSLVVQDDLSPWEGQTYFSVGGARAQLDVTEGPDGYSSVSIANFCLDGTGYVLVGQERGEQAPVLLINR